LAGEAPTASARHLNEVDWGAIRSDYPALTGRAYLDTACKGIPSSRAATAITDQLALLRESPSGSTTGETIGMLEQFGRARAACAALIGAGSDEIALMPSTEAGLAAVAAALGLDPGTNVVASDLEFVGTVLPWRSLERTGVQVKLVPHRDGRVDLDDFDAAMDRQTRAVVISAVQEVNGFRTDLDELARLCRGRSVLLIVDAIQHIGPIGLDVGTTPLDAVAVGGHKWLCAPFGMGFLYVSRRLVERLRPPSTAFMTAQPPSGEWGPYLESPGRHPQDSLVFPRDARKLELGGLGTTLAAGGLAAAVETLLHIGPQEIAARSRQLTELTLGALRSAGAEIVTPESAPPSSIVTFRTAPDIEAERLLVERLSASRILTSLRFTTGVGGIRVSPYFYNDEDDIDRLATCVRGAIEQRRRARARSRETVDPG